MKCFNKKRCCSPFVLVSVGVLMCNSTGSWISPQGSIEDRRKEGVRTAKLSNSHSLVLCLHCSYSADTYRLATKSSESIRVIFWYKQRQTAELQATVCTLIHFNLLNILLCWDDSDTPQVPYCGSLFTLICGEKTHDIFRTIESFYGKLALYLLLRSSYCYSVQHNTLSDS